MFVFRQQNYRPAAPNVSNKIQTYLGKKLANNDFREFARQMYVHVYILQFLKRNFVVEIVKGLLIHFLREGTTFTSHKKVLECYRK